MTFFGKRCVPAGVFCGLERLARQVSPGVESIAPHTPILRRLRGRKLATFWTRLTWITQNQLLPLRDISPLLHRADLLVLLLAVGNLAVWLWLAMECLPRTINPVVFATVYTCVVFGFATVLYFAARGIAVWMANPLPDGIKTFRDLATILSARYDDDDLEHG